ncbi:MAG: hypothetical protein ABIQ59_04030 [Nocardioidaceae bacterium]
MPPTRRFVPPRPAGVPEVPRQRLPSVPQALPEPEPEPEPVPEPKQEPEQEPEQELLRLPCGCLAPPPETAGAGGHPGAGAPHEHEHARRRPAVLLAALVGVGVLVLAAFLFFRGPDPAPEAGRPAPTAPRAQVPEEDPPAAVATPGSYARSQILNSGEIRVSQWIRSAEVVPGVDLRLPDPGVTDGSIRATEVVVTAGGLPVPGAATVGARAQHYEFKETAELVHVTYSLTGAVVRSPSVPGRALAQVTSLTADGPDGPRRIDLVGDVTSAACLTGVDLAPQPCGEPDDDGQTWRVVLRGADRDAAVQAQVDLG